MSEIYYKPLGLKKKEEKKKNDQPWYLDAIDYMLRPNRAITGYLSNITDKDKKTTPWQGFKRGFTGAEKKDFDQILNNLGWHQKEKDEPITGLQDRLESFVQGRKGNPFYAPDLFDLVNFAGGMVTDPLTYTGIGALAKATASGAVRITAKNVAKKATEKIAGKAVELQPSLTVKGQNKAIDKLLDDISKKTVDDTAKINIADEFGNTLKTQDEVVNNLNRLQKEKSAFVKGELQAGKSFNDVDVSYYDNLIAQSTQALRDFKAATTPLNRDLVGRTYGKKIEDAVKESRAKGENSLLSVNLPFTKFEASILPKSLVPGLKVVSGKIGAKEAVAANELAQQAFMSAEESSQIKQLTEEKPTGYKNEIKKIEDSVTKKTQEFVKKAYNKTSVQDLTTQEFQDLLQRLGSVKARNLPDAKVTQAMINPQTGKPTFNVEKESPGYKSKFLRDFSVKGIPKETRKLLDELDYYLNIAVQNKGLIAKGLNKEFLEYVSKNVTGRGKNKGKAINEEIKKRIDDLKGNVDFSQYQRYVTPTSQKTITGLDTSRFVEDAGGTSKIGDFLRNNMFNARTLRSKERNVNEMANLIVDTNNLVMGREREMQKMMQSIKANVKGLSDDQIQDIIYAVQREFPDRLLDDEVAQEVVGMRVDLQDLKEQYKAIKNSKSEANIAKAEELKQQIETLTNEISSVRNKNKLSFKEAILRIANGDSKKAQQIEAVARQMSRVAKEIKRADEAAGDLYQTRANYFPHVINRTPEEIDQLKAIYKDDPEIGSLISKSKSNRFAKERKSYQTMAEVDNVLSTLQERVFRLQDEGLDTTEIQNKIDVIENLYERDPFTAMTKRYSKSIKANAMRNLQTELTKNGYVIPKGKNIPQYIKSSEKDYYKELNADEARALGLAEGTKVHREVLDGLSRVSAVFSDKGMEKALRNLEAANNIFKTVTTTIIPSHHWYNVIGLSFNNTLAGVTPDAYGKAAVLLYARNSGKLNKEQQKIVNDMLDKGVLNQTSYGDMLESSFTARDNRVDDSDLFTKVLRGAEKSVTENPFVRGIRSKVQDPVDNYYRVAHYLHVLDETRSPKMAADSVRKHLFNYQELTQADRGVRAIVPFWNWTKNNIPLQLEKFFTAPKFAATYAKIKEQSQGDLSEDSDIPGYLLNDAFRFGDDLYNPRPPIQDLATLGDFGKMMGMVSPIFRSPIELGANYQFFKGKPIDYDKYYGNSESYFDNPDTLIRYLLGQTGATSRIQSGISDFQNDEDTKNLLENIRDNFLIGRVRNIEDIKNKTEYKKDDKKSKSKVNLELLNQTFRQR